MTGITTTNGPFPLQPRTHTTAAPTARMLVTITRQQSTVWELWEGPDGHVQGWKCCARWLTNTEAVAALTACGATIDDGDPMKQSIVFGRIRHQSIGAFHVTGGRR